MEKLKKARAQILKYSAFFAWYARDVFRLFRYRLALIALANLAGIMLQANAVFLLYKYARSLENGTIIEVAGWVMNPRTSVELLAGTALAVLFLLLVSSLLIMRARMGAIRLGREYSDFCSQRIYRLASRLPSGLTPAANDELTQERIAIMTRRDSQLCGIILRMSIYVLLPAGTVIAAGLTMFVVNPWISLVVCSILLAIALQLYRMSVHGATQRSLIERRIQDLAFDRLRLMDRVALCPVPLEIDDECLVYPFKNGAVAAHADALDSQRYVLERSFLTAQVAMGVAVFFVLLIQGGINLRYEGNWTALVGYLVILRLFAANFAKTVRALTNINRFYQPVSRYARFVENASAALELGPGSQVVGGFRLVTRSIASGADRIDQVLELVGPRPIALVAATSVNRYMTRPLAERIQVVDGDQLRPLGPPAWFAPARPLTVPASLRDACGLSKDCSRAALVDELNRLGEGEIAKRMPGSLDELLSEAQITDLGGATLFLLTVLSGAGGDACVRVIDAGGLTAVGSLARAAILDSPRGQLTFIAYTPDTLDGLGQFGESIVLIADNKTLYGYCSADAVRGGDPEVRRWIAKLRTKVRTRQQTEISDLEEVEGEFA